MTTNLTDSILPELHIHMNFLPEVPMKKCKSTTNSPRALLETSIGSFKLRSITRENMSKHKQYEGEVIDTIQLEKLKGLEAIGLFSEFGFAKHISGYLDCDEISSKKRTIHITDFMRNGNKMSLIRCVGGLEAYSQKKHEFQKEVMLRDTNIKKFFHHTEKLPEFFSSPQNSPRSTLVCPKKACSGMSQNQKIIDIDHIIEKCEEAMRLKPPKFMTKSTSPRVCESISEKKVQKKFRFAMS